MPIASTMMVHSKKNVGVLPSVSSKGGTSVMADITHFVCICIRGRNLIEAVNETLELSLRDDGNVLLREEGIVIITEVRLDVEVDDFLQLRASGEISLKLNIINLLFKDGFILLLLLIHHLLKFM